MGFKDGNKEGQGRPKGAKNKSTILGREMLEKYFFKDKGLENLLQDIDGMEYERDRVNARIKMLEFVMPKQKEIDLKTDASFGILQLSFDGSTGIQPIQSESDIEDEEQE